MQKLYKSVKIL